MKNKYVGQQKQKNTILYNIWARIYGIHELWVQVVQLSTLHKNK